jgi:hypothetical protein
MLAVGLAAVVAHAAGPPQWWAGRGVLTTNAANDFAALNTGQLKHLALMAWLELETLPGGAGFAPAFVDAGNNYAAVNIGQLKETARPFYDRLGLAGHYPWPDGPGANNAALANIGQAKFLFSVEWRFVGDLDRDGLPDGWELEHGLDALDDSDAQLDSDGDGVINLDEFLLGGESGVPGGFPPQPSGSAPSGLLVLTPGEQTP